MENFVAEFLIHPAALEFSGYACDHGCKYCFAKKSREYPWEKVYRFIREVETRKNLASELFRQGYAVCLSNSTDPFTEKNGPGTKAIVKQLNNFENGIYFQTKFGKSFDDVMSVIDKKNCVFYVTITTSDDEISKKIEPNAPLPSERIRRVNELRKQGYLVEVGLNPWVEQWWPDNGMRYVFDSTTSGENPAIFLMRGLYFPKGIETIPFVEKENYDSIDGNTPKAQCDTWEFFYWILKNYPVKISSPALKYPNTSHGEYEKYGLKAMPTFQNWFHWVEKNPKETYCFSDFLEALSKGNEKLFSIECNESYIRAYLYRISLSEWKKSIGRYMGNFVELVRTIWNSEKIYQSPQNAFDWSKVGHDDNGDVIIRKEKENEHS